MCLTLEIDIQEVRKPILRTCEPSLASSSVSGYLRAVEALDLGRLARKPGFPMNVRHLFLVNDQRLYESLVLLCLKPRNVVQ